MAPIAVGRVANALAPSAFDEGHNLPDLEIRALRIYPHDDLFEYLKHLALSANGCPVAVSPVIEGWLQLFPSLMQHQARAETGRLLRLFNGLYDLEVKAMLMRHLASAEVARRLRANALQSIRSYLLNATDVLDDYAYQYAQYVARTVSLTGQTLFHLPHAPNEYLIRRLDVFLLPYGIRVRSSPGRN
jgi:hypothetical protein